jgi:antitoxin component YwqK of YwqJK toxin-antitoxin module
LRKILAYLLLFFIFFTCKAQTLPNQYRIKKLIYRGDSILAYPSDSLKNWHVGIIPSLPNGIYYGFFRNDTASLVTILQYKNEKLDGDYKEYSFYTAGQLKMKMHYSQGELEGPWQQYENDSIHCEGRYIKGKKEGFQYSYDTYDWKDYKPSHKPYDVCFYKSGKLIYENFLMDSIVYYEGWKMRYYLYPKSKRDSSGGMETSKGKEGLWREYYYNGRLKSIGGYKNDLKNGDWKNYYNNGKLDQEYTCTPAKGGGWESTPIVAFDSSGNKLDIGDYKNGKGVKKEYYPNGKLENETAYSGKGMKAYFKYYGQDGCTVREEYYKVDEENGVWKDYYDSGKLEKQYVYRHRILNGPSIFYRKNGKIQMKGKLKDCNNSLIANLWWMFLTEDGALRRRQSGTGGIRRNKQGEWFFYDTTGALYCSQRFKYDIPCGKCTYYYSNGKIKEQLRFKSQRWRQGKDKEWAENGVLIKETIYKYNAPVKETIYYASGRLKSIKRYKLVWDDNGLWPESIQDGKQEFRYEDGNEIIIEHYRNGKSIEKEVTRIND